MYSVRDIDRITKLIQQYGIGPMLKLIADIVMFPPPLPKKRKPK
jgi:hypothetical protein